MLKLESLYKEFKTDDTEVRAVNQISFEVPEGKFFTLLGPSGCGKTTTLRCVAGLERPGSGRIFIDGELVSGGITLHRPIRETSAWSSNPTPSGRIWTFFPMWLFPYGLVR